MSLGWGFAALSAPSDFMLVFMPVKKAFEVLTIEDLQPALQEHFQGAASFGTAEPPSRSGVYIWYDPDDDGVLYVGSAKSLAARLGNERGWICGHDPATMWEVSVVHMLKLHSAEVVWVETVDHDDALILESRLIEWHRANVGVAPLIVGWEAKADSKRGLSERWARNLWESMNASSEERPATEA